jgi:hypothetical protein
MHTVTTSIGAFVLKVDVAHRLYGNRYNVARTFGATEFSQIDDPSALDCEDYHTGILGVGHIACLRSENGYLLVKRIEGEPGSHAMAFEYEARGSIE